MNEEVSALMDGQLGDEHSAGCMKRLKENPEARAAWNVYHLIGDTLRGHAALSLPSNFAQRLQDEPTVLAPRPKLHRTNARTRIALSAAAGISAVAFVGWMSYPFLGTTGGPDIAATPVLIQPVTAKAEAGTGAIVPVADLDDYQLAHRHYSPGFGMTRVAPYARNVSAADGQR